jgi:hypothetical protein
VVSCTPSHTLHRPYQSGGERILVPDAVILTTNLMQALCSFNGGAESASMIKPAVMDLLRPQS